MNIKDFIGKLAPALGRDRIGENLVNLREQINVTIIPSLEALRRVFPNDSKAPENREIATTYAHYAKGKIKGTMINDILERYRKMPDILDAVEREVRSNFGKDVIPLGMDYRKANVLRLLNVVGFLNKFVMTLTNAYAHYELKETGLQMDYVSDVTKGTAKRIEKYLPDFVTGLTGITSVEKFESALNHLPEMTVDLDDASGISTAKFDIFGLFTMSNFTVDPAYWIAVGVAQWQMKNYKDMVNKKELLEYRILMLERVRARESSPELESKIRDLSSQVARLADEIRREEESFA